MAEYIEREFTLHRMKVDIRPPFEVVRDMPAADVAPVVHGRWAIGNRHGEPGAECPVCGSGLVFGVDEIEMVKSIVKELHYCPSCGAKMDLGVSQR